MTPGPGFEPGPHWWEAIAITTAPSLLPKSGSTLSPLAMTFLQETDEICLFVCFLHLFMHPLHMKRLVDFISKDRLVKYIEFSPSLNKIFFFTIDNKHKKHKPQLFA